MTEERLGSYYPHQWPSPELDLEIKTPVKAWSE
jgi:hypothetical protein